MAKNKITKSELKTRTGFVLLGIFAAYLVGPLEELINQYIQVDPIVLGVLGFFAVLYFFDF